MIARLIPLTLAAFIACAAVATAQTTVTGPGGPTVLPPNGSQSKAATYPDPANNDTASPPLGPQQNIGEKINRTVHYIAGDYIAPPIVYDAFSTGNKGLNGRSFAGRAVFEIPLAGYNVYVGADARKWTYPTTGGLVTGIGGSGRGFIPSHTAVDYDEDVRAGIKVGGPRLYAAASYLKRGTTNFEPTERGLGFGIEKLADVDQNFSLHGNVFLYPNVSGRYSINGVGDYGVSYRMVRYLIGVSLQPNHSPVFLDAGYLGDRSHVRTDAPVGFNHQGPYVGLGIHF